MIIVIMGPSGCGKSTIGSVLSSQINWPFIEGDDYHSESNKAKMSIGIPLSDEDRLPWLQFLRNLSMQHDNVVLACSALKASYRNILSGSNYGDDRITLFVLLSANKSLLQKRISGRKGHFMSPSLLQSQLETLEPFEDYENYAVIDANNSVAEVTQQIINAIDSKMFF
ncbi:hypothetical protein MN116_005302 [Schistosoma mekongi]|uniref:Gluconokinase n=1 Tax=Schistosoma mekongi TaxID=38744 RepID=A0AAE1ZEC3_SCHME|nr:hypothetical protein MN116_005302 [Schistosoma mekongi]